jgi:hypothetical protein
MTSCEPCRPNRWSNCTLFKRSDRTRSFACSLNTQDSWWILNVSVHLHEFVNRCGHAAFLMWIFCSGTWCMHEKNEADPLSSRWSLSSISTTNFTMNMFITRPPILLCSDRSYLRYFSMARMRVTATTGVDSRSIKPIRHQSSGFTIRLLGYPLPKHESAANAMHFVRQQTNNMWHTASYWQNKYLAVYALLFNAMTCRLSRKAGFGAI